MDSAVDAVLSEFQSVTSRKAARSYLQVVATLGLIECRRRNIEVTGSGKRFLRTRDPRIVKSALMDRVAGVAEIIDVLNETPLRIGLLLPRVQALGFESWTTASQIRHRLRWLEEVGVVESRGNARPVYYVSSKGNARLTPKRAAAHNMLKADNEAVQQH